MKIELKLSFVKDTVDGGFYLLLFEKYVKFQPSSFRRNYITKSWNERKHKKLMRLITSDGSLGIAGDNNDLFSTSNTGTENPHRTISIIQGREAFLPSNEEIEFVIKGDGFIAAYLYNEDYENVQSTSHSNNYEHRNYSNEILNSIRNTPYKINEFGNKEYDTKFNPGRSVLTGHAWLIVGFKMWFGDAFFKLVSKEKILSFAYATEIRELPNNIVYVQLYDKIEEPYTPDNMFRQWKWREWMDYDNLERIYG